MILKRSLQRCSKLAIALGIITLAFTSCKGDKTNNAQLENGNTFLTKVMQASGGVKNYKNIKRITFKKAFHLYREDGSLEMDRTELHSYDFTNGTNRLIQWKENNVTYNLIEKNEKLFETHNPNIDTTVTREQLQKKLNAATFVLGLPYTINNDGSTKTYNGIKDFEGKPAHELEVAFTNSTDVWKMYYSQDSLDWLGYWVKTADHYSLVINEEMTEVNGFTFTRKRTSYRTDAQKNRLYLRADYEYSNYLVE